MNNINFPIFGLWLVNVLFFIFYWAGLYFLSAFLTGFFEGVTGIVFAGDNLYGILGFITFVLTFASLFRKADFYLTCK